MKNLSLINYGNGFSTWHYKSELSFSELLKPEFFSDATELLEENDLLIILAKDNAEKLKLKFFQIISIAKKKVILDSISGAF